MAAEQHVETAENTLKRKFEPSVLDNFTKLTNSQEKIRIKSGVELLRHLTDHESNEGEQTGNELKYALGRLIRGLGSPKIHARTGFFACLVGLLNLKDVTVQEIFEIVAKELHKGGNNSKSENADVCSGQILIAGAILRSDLYTKCTDEDKIKVLELLINAGKERTYLTLASYKFITDLYNKINSKEFEKLVLPLIRAEITKPWSEHNLDSLYLLIETQRKFPDVIKAKFLKNSLGTTEIFTSSSLHELCNILTTIPRITALKHPLFDICIEKITQSNLIHDFFIELDKLLIKSNRNKYFVFLQLITGIFDNLVDKSVIPNLLTKNFLQQTLNIFKTAVGKHKDKEFTQKIQKFFDKLLESLKNETVKSKTKIQVLKQLLFYPGTFIFEKVTKSKLIQNITQTLNIEGVKKLAEIYKEVITAKSERVVNDNMNEKWWNNDRIYASHLLIKLLNHQAMRDNNEWKIEQLNFLMQLGLYANQDDNIGNELADAFKDAFYSSLDLKLAKLEDLRFILASVVKNLDSTLSSSALDKILREPLSSDDYETWKRTVALCNKIENKKKKAVFHTLFLHLALQLFKETKLASDSLKELFSCYERVSKKKKSEDNSDDPLWIEVVIDLFLNLLSHNSHLLRSVINCVFPHLCEYMTSNAIHQILSVLDPKNEDNPLSKDSDSEDSDDEDEEDDDEEEEEEADDDDIDEEDETVSDKLRMALHQALGDAVESDAESVNLDDLDDEEGAKLDEALSQAFKQFRPNLGHKKKQNKDAQLLTHFRIRVLDLIEIYLNSNPSLLLTLEIMLPLLQILEFTIRDDHQKPLQDRVRACLKKLTALKKFGDLDGVNDEILVDLLKSLLEKGTKNAIIVQDMGEKIAECCVFIVNCSQLIASNAETPKKKKKNRISVSSVIRDNLEIYFKKRDCLTPYVLFKNVLQLNWEGILDLIPLLTGFVFTDTIRPFRRSQALELLKIFYNNHRFLDSHATETIDETERNLLLDSIDFFKNFCENPTERKVKEKFICNLFLLLNEIKNSRRGALFTDWQKIADVIRECRSHVTFSKDTKVAFGRLCKSLNVSNIVKMKSNMVKLNNDNDDNDNEKVAVDEEQKVNKKKKKKKKLDKEKLKQKKESKELRMQTLSEGLGGKRKFAEENGDVNKKVKMDVSDDDGDM